MATLYEMNAQAKRLYDLLQDEEIDEQTYHDVMESIGIDKKLESCCYIIRQFEADEELFRNEAARLMKRARISSDRIDWLKTQVKQYLEATNQKKERAGIFTAALSTSQSVNITDESAIPEEYMKPQPPKVDKATIRDLLKKGHEVSGAELVTNTNVRIGYGKVDDNM